MSDVTGDIVHKSSSFHGEWRIPDFPSLSQEVDECCASGTFCFSNACWCLSMYPNGEKRDMGEGRIGLYITRNDCGPPVNLSYSLGVRKADGTEKVVFRLRGKQLFNGESGWGPVIFLSRAELLSQMSDLAPAGTLTITYTLENDRPHSMDAALCRRLWNTSIRLQGLLKSQETADVTFKLEDGEVRAHSMILEGRSEVFKRMFATDMQESRTGQVNIPEADKASFQVALHYVYSGEPSELSSKNLCRVYRIAHRYDLEELTRLCAEFMTECISVDTVCDFLEMAEEYQEIVLKGRATDFFVNNVTEVVKKEEWKTLKRKNPDMVSELLESIVVRNVAKIKL